MYRFMRFPEGKEKALTFSYDDGIKSDIRLAGLFSSYGFKATFNINSANIGAPNRLTKEEIQEHILDKGHEVAIHGQYHQAPGASSIIGGIKEFLNCRLALEKEFGRILKGCAYPDTGIVIIDRKGKREEIAAYMKELGFSYARTLGSDNDSFCLPGDFLEWMPSCHHVNPEVLNYAEKFSKLSVSNGYIARAYPRLLYIWGHAYEFDNNNNWDLVDKLGEILAGKNDIWYATNIEIHDYVKAYESLVFSADELTVYNPTLITVWFFTGGKNYKVEPGETVNIEWTAR